MSGNCDFCFAVRNLTSLWGSEIDQSNRKYKFSSVYKLESTLGKGQFGIVKKCRRKDDNTRCAVKRIDKSNLCIKDEESVREEIQILESLDHPHVLRLFESYDETNYHYLVTELMEGGELFDRIVSKTTYSEKETRDVCKIVFEAVDYCHNLNIAHRDLKPENLLLMSKHNDSDIKIADFGLAKRVSPDHPNCLRTKCGTPEYAAPDVLGVGGKLYGIKADMWSMGVIIFILLSGYPPFSEQATSKLLLKIRTAEYTFDDDYWCNVSDSAKDLVSKLLVVDPAKRLSAKEALNHKWMLENSDSLAKLDLQENLENLKKFNATRKFRATTRAVMMSNKLRINAILNKESSTRVRDSKQ